MLTTRELTERIVHRHDSDQAWRDAYQAIRIMLNRLQSLQEIVDNLNTPDRQGAGQFSTPYDEMYTLVLQNAVKVASHRYGKDQSAAPMYAMIRYAYQEGISEALLQREQRHGVTSQEYTEVLDRVMSDGSAYTQPDTLTMPLVTNGVVIHYFVDKAEYLSDLYTGMSLPLFLDLADHNGTSAHMMLDNLLHVYYIQQGFDADFYESLVAHFLDARADYATEDTVLMVYMGWVRMIFASCLVDAAHAVHQDDIPPSWTYMLMHHTLPAPDEVVQYIRNLGTLMFRRHRNQARYTRNVR